MATEMQASQGLSRGQLEAQPRDVPHRNLIATISIDVVISEVGKGQTKNPSLIEINSVLPFWVY